MIVQKYISLDQYYRESTGTKIILNDLDEFSSDDIDTVNNSLMTVYNSDTIDIIPTCDCGHLKGAYLEGTICNYCGTEVVNPQDQMNSILWLKALDNDMLFLSPHYWLMLRNVMSKKIDYLRWLADTSYNPPIDIPSYMYGLKDMLGERSYPNVINNIDKIIIFLKEQPKFKKPTHMANLNMLLDVYTNQRDTILSNYLPVPNKKLFVMENTSKGKFTNLTVSDMIDLVMSWIKVSSGNKTFNRKSNSTASVVSKLATLYSNYFGTYISSKVGIFRKHAYSFRSHFTFRAVITSIPGRHEADGVIVPWVIGVTAYRPHILNKLIKRGYTYKQANKLLFKVVGSYDEVVSEILDELILEAKDQFLPVLIQRNPSLLQMSAIKVKISSFSKDPSIKSLQISSLIAKNMNADFDGDAINATLLLDNKIADAFDTFTPYHGVVDINKPYSISGNLTLLSSATSIVSNYADDNNIVNNISDPIDAQLTKVDIGKL